VVRLTVTHGCFVLPCGIRETSIVLECSTVKVVAPGKREVRVLCSGDSDIVNDFVNPIASGASHESQFGELTGEFARSNLLTYGVKVVFKVEFVSNSTDRESVLLNQGRKVANLSDRGYELCSDVSDVVASQFKTDGIWSSGASVEFCVFDASRLKWFPHESARCPLSIKPMGSEVVRVLSFKGWSQRSIKPMGYGCDMISGINSGVLGFADEQGQASCSVVVIGQWTFSSSESRLNPNFSEEFELGNGACVESQVQADDELVPVNLQQSASQCFTSPRVANRSFAQESNRSTELAVSVSPGGPEPSLEDSNRPNQNVSQPYACGDAQGRGNLPVSMSGSESS